MDNTPSESFFSSDSTYFFGAPGTNLEEEEPLRPPQQQHQEEDDEAVDSLLNPLQLFLSSLVDDDDEDDVRHREHRALSASDDGKCDPVGSSSAVPSYVSVVLRETSGPVENYSSGSTSAGVAPLSSSSSSLRSKHKVCPFFLQGICRYGEHCRYLHEFGSRCPQCGFAVPVDEIAQQKHMMQCQEMTLVAEERRASAEVKCGICFDLVVRAGRKFGLLQGCSHAFCLPCIRSWRGSLGQAKETLRACPLCRQDSHFVIPCDRMVFDPERKHDVIERYKERLHHIECKWFNRGRGSCPFGSSCFYAHYNQDGTFAEPERLQHLEHGDGEVEIMKPMRLSDFLE